MQNRLDNFVLFTGLFNSLISYVKSTFRLWVLFPYRMRDFGRCLMKLLNLALALILIFSSTAQAQSECVTALSNKPEIQLTPGYNQTLKEYKALAVSVHKFIGLQLFNGSHRNYAPDKNPLPAFLKQTESLLNNYENNPTILKIMGEALIGVLSLYTLGRENPNRSIFKIEGDENSIDKDWENTSLGIWALLIKYFGEKNHTNDTLSNSVELRSSLQNGVENAWISKTFAAQVVSQYETAMNNLSMENLQRAYNRYFFDLIPLQNKDVQFQRHNLATYFQKLKQSQIADYDALSGLMIAMQMRRGLLDKDTALLLIDVMVACRADAHRNRILLNDFRQLLNRSSMTDDEREHALAAALSQLGAEAAAD